MKTICVWLLVCVLETECSHSAKLSKLTGRDREAFPAVMSDVESSNTELNGDGRRENEIKRDEVTCPSEFVFLPEADRCYKVVLDTQYWESARNACAKLQPGSHTAAILSKEANDAVKKFLKKEYEKAGTEACNGGFFWTSGQMNFDGKCGKDFQWKISTDERLPFGFTDWHKGEPNCQDKKEQCVDLIAGYDFEWNDERCNNPLCPLCEYKPSPQ